MPKKKKTRKQKILADLRRKTVETKVPQTSSLPVEVPKTKYQVQYQTDNKDHGKQIPTQLTVATSKYQYLYYDLLKTIIVTFSIVAGELLLRYLFF